MQISLNKLVSSGFIPVNCIGCSQLLPQNFRWDQLPRGPFGWTNFGMLLGGRIPPETVDDGRATKIGWFQHQMFCSPRSATFIL